MTNNLAAVPSLSTPLTTTSVVAVRSSSPAPLSLLLLSVLLSPSRGKLSSPPVSSWVLPSAPRMLLSPSTPLKWPRLAFVVPSSCSGSSGSPLVSFLANLSIDVEPFADVVTRYLPRIHRQRHRQERRQDRLASRARFGLHPRLLPYRRYLLLPRVSSLAHEEGEVRRGFPVHVQAPCPPHHRRPRLLLLLRYLRGGAQDGPGCRLLPASVGLLRRSQDQEGKLRCLDRHVGPADVWNQQ